MDIFSKKADELTVGETFAVAALYTVGSTVVCAGLMAAGVGALVAFDKLSTKRAKKKNQE